MSLYEDIFGHSAWPNMPLGGGGGGRRRPANPAPAADETHATPEQEKANTPPAAGTEAKPKARLLKAGWVEAKTFFDADAEVFAEFEIPASEKARTLVDFKIQRKDPKGFVDFKSGQGHVDENGRATAKIPLPREGVERATFRILAKHCAGDWSDGSGTEREVSEAADAAFEHDHLSGIHFPKDSSFIAPAYLETFRNLESKFTEWKKTHPNAKIVVYGHSEKDENNPRKISARRAEIAFAFLIGDHATWARIAKEEKWGVWEQQHMLAAMNFYKDKVDGKKGPNTNKAIREFIDYLNKSEHKTYNPDLGFTEEYLRKELYRVYITNPKRAVSIPSENFKTVTGFPFLGCGAVNRYKDGPETHSENRRVVFLLAEESRSFPADFPCKSSSISPCEQECGRPGERHAAGFRCGFYDDIFRGDSTPNPPIDKPVAEVRFYIIRDGSKVEVESPSDLLAEEYPHKDTSHAKVITVKGAQVFSKHDDAVLGRATILASDRGIAFIGDEKLYDMLIKGGGDPNYTIPARSKRIWASIYHSEGTSDAINSYDTAFISMGAIQQTAGTKGNAGELPAALHSVAEKDRKLYDTLLGDFGIKPVDVDSNQPGNQTGYFEINGAKIKTAPEKSILRQFWIAYRIREALRNASFRKLFYEYGFRRLDLIDGAKKTVDGKTYKFSEIYRTDLAAALVLDAHINLPSTGMKIWWEAALSVIPDPEDFGDGISVDQEKAMIKEILRLRNKSAMTDPKFRAAYIVLCVKDIDDTLAKELGYSEGMDGLAEDARVPKSKGLDALKLGFLELSR